MKTIFTLAFIAFSFLGTAQVYTFQKGEKYGIQDLYNKIVYLEPEYDMIYALSLYEEDRTYFSAEKNGRADLYVYFKDERALKNLSKNENFTFIEGKVLNSNQNKGVTLIGYNEKGEAKTFDLQRGWETLMPEKDEIVYSKNKKGEFIFCKNGAQCMDRTFNSIYLLESTFYVANDTEGDWIFDQELNAFIDFSVDAIYASAQHATVFIIQKGEQYGIVSTDESMSVPLSSFKNPQSAFGFDGPAYANLEKPFVVEKNGKFGLISNKNQQLLPYEFENGYVIDDLEDPKVYDTRVVMKAGKDWVFYNQDLKELGRAQIDDFVNISWNGSVEVLTNNKVLPFDMKEFLTLPVGDTYYDEYNVVYSMNWTVGVVKKDGSLLVPFDYNQISRHDREKVFTCNSNDGKGYFISYDGEILTSVDGIIDNMAAIKNADLCYLALTNGTYKYAFASWNPKTNEVKIYTDFEYSYIAFNYQSEDEIVATATDYSANKVHQFYRDGTVKTVDKE